MIQFKAKINWFLDKVVIYLIFKFLLIITLGYNYTPNVYKWYRKWKGGIWYETYYPIQFPYGSFWTQDEKVLEEAGCVLLNEEDYTK